MALASLTALGCNNDALSGNNMSGTDGGDGDGGTLGPDGSGFDTDAACGMVNAAATLTKAPVDIIMVVDNSGSMTQEIQGVQSNINMNFATILKNSGLDYRVILISHHGSATADQSICIDAPLAGNASCNPPPATPTFTAQFYQYSQEIASTNSLALILSTYNKADTLGMAPNGWSAWLRPNAVKTFIEVTDDNQGTAYTAASFDSALRALSPTQFGTANKRNYVFHSIIGVKEQAVVTQAYQPTDAVVTTRCSTAVNTGPVYQDLSILTGGLRFPVCQYTNYDAVFKTVAQGVVTGTTVSCDFPVPMAPPGKTFILTTAQLKYTPGDGSAPQYFKQVSGLTQCDVNSFYISNNEIYMCPNTCTTVQADPKAQIALALDCSAVIG
jgi:hypothetical protein